MKFAPPTLIALALAVAGCERPAAADPPLPMAAAGTAEAPTQGPAGKYVMSGQRRGLLTLTPKGDVWRVSLSGGALSDGAATAADCELEAEGALKDGRIEARVVPFEGTNISLSAADLATRPATARVTLNAETASVSTDFQGCGVGADELRYRRGFHRVRPLQCAARRRMWEGQSFLSFVFCLLRPSASIVTTLGPGHRNLRVAI